MKKDLPKSTKVVVIGGGVAGCSCAYHLAKFGWKDTIILERIPKEITFDDHYDTSKDEQFGNKMLNLKTRFNRLMNFHGNAEFTEFDGKVISLQLQKLR